MAKTAKKIYDEITDAVMNSGFEETALFSEAEHDVVVIDETELRNYYGIELEANKLALMVKKDLYTSLSRGSVLTFKGTSYEVKSKTQDFYGTYIVGLIEHE